MLRATRIEDDDGGQTLRVEGRLTQDTAAELQTACDAVLATHGALRLDVAGVRFVDQTGVELLRGLEDRGASLGGCSAFVRELLRNGPPPQTAAPLDLEAVIREHGGRMLATARRFVGSEEDARDVTQAAFLAALRALDGFAGTAQLSTWLHRIVINTALMKLRSRRRRPERSIEELLPRFAEDGHWAEPQSEWGASPDALIGRRQTRTMVRAAIDGLPESHRSVLLLRDIEELDTDETAALLGISVNAVRTRLHRARQALRTLLQERFEQHAA